MAEHAIRVLFFFWKEKIYLQVLSYNLLDQIFNGLKVQINKLILRQIDRFDISIYFGINFVFIKLMGPLFQYLYSKKIIGRNPKEWVTLELNLKRKLKCELMLRNC